MRNQPTYIVITLLLLGIVASQLFASEMMFTEDFSNGIAQWYTVGSMTVDTSEGEACITINDAAANPWDVQLGIQERFNVEMGEEYTVSFDAYASQATTINAVWILNQDPWSTYWDDAVALTTERQTFSYAFTLAFDSDPVSAFGFQLGAQAAEMVCIDDVTLSKVITNSTPSPTETTPEPDNSMVLLDDDFSGELSARWYTAGALNEVRCGD